MDLGFAKSPTFNTPPSSAMNPTIGSQKNAKSLLYYL